MNLISLHMALRYSAERGDATPGRAQADLRLRIAQETPDDFALPLARQALVVFQAHRLDAISIEDMPPGTDDVALLLDTLAFTLGLTARADAWRAIGINPNRGRELLARNAHAVDWPIWFTLKSHALGA